MQDQEAFERIKLGDKEALAEVYKAHREAIIAWLTKKHSCSMEEAKDIYQDAILIFYNNIVKGKLTNIQHSIGSYLHEVVKRQFFSKAKRDSKLSRGIIEILKETSSSDEENMAELERRMEMVHQGLKEVGEVCSQLIRLRYFNRLSMDTICVQLGYKNSSTAKNLKYKCMRRLRKIVMRMVKHDLQILR